MLILTIFATAIVVLLTTGFATGLQAQDKISDGVVKIGVLTDLSCANADVGIARQNQVSA